MMIINRKLSTENRYFYGTAGVRNLKFDTMVTVKMEILAKKRRSLKGEMSRICFINALNYD